VNKKTLGSALFAALLVLPSLAFAGGQTLSSMACNVQQAAVGVAIPVVVVGWVIAGVLYLTSAGAPERMGIAKKAIIACVIGTVLATLAVGSYDILSVIANIFGITPPSNSCMLYQVSHIAMTLSKSFIA
jgi:hypothetical protein